MAAIEISRRLSTASSSTVATDVESDRVPERMRSSTSSRACANLASAGKPSPAALPLIVWAARKMAWSVSTSSGTDSRRTKASSIWRRFSSVSALKMASSSSRSKSIGSIAAPLEAPHPGRAVVRLEDQLAPALAVDVLGDDRNAFGLQDGIGHLHVLRSEVAGRGAERAQHAGAAEHLGL